MLYQKDEHCFVFFFVIVFVVIMCINTPILLTIQWNSQYPDPYSLFPLSLSTTAVVVAKLSNTVK